MTYDIKEIFDLMDSPTKEDIELLTRAYTFASEAHKDHKRFSGEPYFTHLFETAKNLAGIKMGAVTISAGLLHDCIEDVGIKPEDLQKEFGDEILFLVNGVTKLGKLKYRGAERYAASLQKLFVSMSQDIRVLIIKLADRLHNMRTLEFVRPEKQVRIASETLEIFAPLAYRLGIRRLSCELEDLSFKYVYSKEAKMVQELLKQKSKENMPTLEKFVRSLKKTLAREQMTNIHTDYRLKGLYSTFRKLKKHNNDIEKIYDFLALRVFAETVADCYKILGIIHGVWRPLPGRIKDYIALPKPNGYQSLHTTVFTGDGGIVEIQIRTEEMHLNAEYGIASHISYKEQKGESNSKDAQVSWFRQFLPKTIPFVSASDNHKSCVINDDIPTWMKDLVEQQARAQAPNGIDEDVKADFFALRMFIFTPKGDVVDLPIDSTPIDFAYAIHSDIGNHTAGAKVNGRMVSLDTKLKNGEIVEIITKNSAKPSSKWLDMTKTNMAKKHIRSFVEEGNTKATKIMKPTKIFHFKSKDKKK